MAKVLNIQPQIATTPIRSSASSKESHSHGYRPDIDGLRALAVLSVVLFHARSTFLPGGYVGVDVFFVISGFLITSIICRNAERHEFSFAQFYARRAKRIFPALFILLIATCSLGWLVLLPEEYESLGKHMAAGAGFISNFALWNESGYFDSAASSKPLLHLWSLGIEEQFYLFWPLVLAFALRRKANLLKIAGCIAIFSFALSVIATSLWRTAAFYLPVTRFWELLSGCVLGYVSIVGHEALNWPKLRFGGGWDGRKFRNVQSVIGFALLIAAFVALDEKSLFPGWWALLPTGGAFLIISAGSDAWINRKILSIKPLVFVGLISYPLYLWHWPLISVIHTVEAGAPSPVQIIGVVSLSFLLASATYWFVERPIRAGSDRLAFVLMPSVFLVGCLGLAVNSHRLHARSEGYHLEKIVAATKEAWGFPGHLQPISTPFGWHWQQGTAPTKVLFLGDSNVQQYYPRIDRLITELPGQTKSAVFVTEHGCAPISLPYVKGPGDPTCGPGLVEHALHLMQADQNIDTVVIGAAWYGYPIFQDPADRDIAFRSFEDAVRQYKGIGRSVYIILPIPPNREFDPAFMVRRSLLELNFEIVQPRLEREEIDAAVSSITSRLTAIASDTGARVLDPTACLCQGNACSTVDADGIPVYRDGGHMRPSFVRNHAGFLDFILQL